jgi:hypothetical protein
MCAQWRSRVSQAHPVEKDLLIAHIIHVRMGTAGLPQEA